jgi:4-hydroxymandelate oxidase
LARIERRDFAEPATDLDRPEHLAGYLADLVRPYPVELVSAMPAGQSYAEMAAALINATVPASRPVDLLLLCFAVPDLHPGRATATYLSHLCPGTPLSFAICEQGSAAAFTGLRIASEYLASEDCQRALLLVLEQAGLPYRVPVPVPAEHRGVALLLESGGDGPQLTGLQQVAGVPADQVAKTLAELTADRPTAPLLLSESLATHWPNQDRTRIVSAGQPLTGLWWQLSDELTEATDLLLADYEPQLGYLSLAAATSN